MRAPHRPAEFGSPPPHIKNSCSSDTRPEVILARPAPQSGDAALVVESDSQIRQFAADVIQELGFTVLRAEKGSAAPELLARHPVDLNVLVTAVMMDGMSGLELAAQLRARWGRLKVIYLSGVTDVVRVNGVMHPCSVSVRKPFTREELGRKLAALLATP
jgi:DNA-binding response OmpR family regulator